MSLTNLLLGVYSSIGITENKPLFYYNSLFYTATRCYFGKFKKTSRVRSTRQGGLWISNLVKQFTFTMSFDDLAILFRVNPVFPVSHLVPFTRFNLTTGFRRKLFDGSEGNYVRKNKFYVRSLRHHAVRYLLMRQERKKKTSYLSCLPKSRKK